ncbi:MAG: hypothetical protein EAX90_07425 [Candidatus Heimdallarchaeota archaeon]|nr:hypothetical protein [Candidatus Heimdallarchaeota archaeon]
MAKKNIVQYVPVIIVMLISVAALVPGILQNNLSEQVEDDTETLNNKQDSYEYFSDVARYVFQFDSDLYSMIWQELAEAKRLDIELTALGENATALENRTIVSIIVDHLMNAYIMADQTYSFGIHMTFTGDPTRETFHLGVSSTGDFLDITREAWETRPTYLLVTFEDFLTTIYGEWYGVPGQNFFMNHTMQLIYEDFSDMLANPFGLLYAANNLYSLDPGSNLYNLTHTPVFEMEGQIAQLRFIVQEGENIINNYKMAVSILTIATIMSTAIAGRLEERKIAHQISKVRADFKDDESIIVSSVDKFSLTLLLIALGIAIVGVLLAFVI